MSEIQQQKAWSKHNNIWTPYFNGLYSNYTDKTLQNN